MDFTLTEDQEAMRAAVRGVCAGFPGAYWRGLDRAGGYPDEFVRALTDLGWLGVLIPEEYGGGGLGMTEAGIVLEEINRSGGCAATCHAQMYTMGTLLRHGSEEQKRRYLPGIAEGRLRLQAFGVTEPDAGSETTRIRTVAERRGDRYVVNGSKVFISRVKQSDLMLLLARTTPYADLDDKTQGLSVFIVDLREAGDAIEVQPLDTMLNHHTSTLSITDLEVPAENLVGVEGLGFRYIIDGWNAERVLIASESVGDGRWFVERASAYTSEREVFGRKIGANQGVQFPIAQAYANVEAASLVRYRAGCVVRRRGAVRAGGEHGEARRVAGRVAGRQRVPRDTRRLRLRSRLRRRAQVPRGEALRDRPGQQQPRARVPRAARARHAEVVLTPPHLGGEPAT